MASTRGRRPGRSSPIAAGPRRGPARGRGVDHGQPGSHRGAGGLVDRHRWPSRAVASPWRQRGAAPGSIVTAAIEGRGVTVASTRSRRPGRSSPAVQDLDGDQLAAVASIMGSQVRTAAGALVDRRRQPGPRRACARGRRRSWATRFAPRGRRPGGSSPRPSRAVASPWRQRGARARVDRRQRPDLVVGQPLGTLRGGCSRSPYIPAAGRSIVGSQVRTVAPSSWWIVIAAVEGRGVTVASTWGRRPGGSSPRPGPRRGPARGRPVDRRQSGSHRGAVALVDGHRWPSRAVASTRGRRRRHYARNRRRWWIVTAGHRGRPGRSWKTG